MKFNLSYGMFKKLKKEYPKPSEASDAIRKSLKVLKYPWYDGDKDEKSYKFDTDRLSVEILETLLAVCEVNLSLRGAKGTHKILQQWMSVRKDVTAVKIKNLNQLVDAVKTFICTSPHHVMFKQGVDSNMLPYLCLGAEYHPASQHNGYYTPAHTDVNFVYNYLDDKLDKASISFEDIDVQRNKKNGDGTVKDILETKGYFLENEKLWEDYQVELSVFHSIKEKVGDQFFASGVAFGSGWRHGTVNMKTREDTPSKCVIDLLDEDHPEKTFNKAMTTSTLPFPKESSADDSDFFIQEAGDQEEESTNYGYRGSDEDGSEKVKYNVEVPDHPYICIFNLYKHDHYHIHVNNVAKYEYDSGLVDKLILPKDHKSLIDMLVKGTADIQEDIIKGKTGGIIVVATGPPGVGKTLSAEVYAELIKVPLYVVQCSQLGIKAEELEKNLQLVLDRSLRWNAILLIDEADVYVHSRGNDIRQNAIVGVFLRILEYYSGVLFMTSNRDTVIDDAILSRALAHIRYKMPGRTHLREIWEVIAKEFKINIPSIVIEDAVKEFDYISGRDVKNILKLSNLLAKRKDMDEVSLDLIKYVIKYQDISEKV